MFILIELSLIVDPILQVRELVPHLRDGQGDEQVWAHANANMYVTCDHFCVYKF